MKPVFEPWKDRIIIGSNIYGEKHLAFIGGVNWDEELEEFVYTTEDDSSAFTESYLIEEGIVLVDRNYETTNDLKERIDELLIENSNKSRIIRNLKTRLIEIQSIAKAVL
ncbi:hypothetical protein phi9181_ORF029 [Enterococcus phage 9181]|nr:hypothetical protein phi9181_ORF029 [Enterococcus phage 9181]